MTNSKNPMFCFYKRNEPIAVIQAKSKRQARERVSLISSHVKIPKDCQVRSIQWGTALRAPVFFEGHFQALEDAIAEAETSLAYFPEQLREGYLSCAEVK